MKHLVASLAVVSALTGCAHLRRDGSSAVDAALAKPNHDALPAHTAGPGGAAASAAGRAARPYDAASSERGKRRWFADRKATSEQQLAQDLAQAESLALSGKLSQARDIYQRLVVEFPQEPRSLHGLAMVADRQRKHHEAQALYVQALASRPREAAWLGDLGWSYYLDGQLEKAHSALAKAVSLAPSEPRHHNNLGLVLGQQRRQAEALEEFRKAGSEADAQYNLAFVLASQDDAAGAKRCFQLALAADPSYTRARDALKSFEQYDEDPKQAELALLDGGQWIPYVEEPAATSNLAAPTLLATHTTPQNPGPAPRERQFQPAQPLPNERTATQGNQ